MRTRVKFCGLTREQDVQTAVQLGVDALGFVFYEPSPRYILPMQAAQLMQKIPAFISTVGLFVNATVPHMTRILNQAAVSTIQLHGDESWNFALNVTKIMHRPVIKAVRVNEQTDWDEVVHYVDQLAGVLLDADAVGYGGAGHVFDWGVIPAKLHHKIILSGGLNLANIDDAVKNIAPYGLDVSSGIEDGVKGVKDMQKMTDFVGAVYRADAIKLTM
jgi:phosphoribosylanthranilate isomerase